MANVTKPIILDETGQRIATALEGMKENVITGHLIPAGTGFPEFRNVIVGSKEEYERQLEADNLETEFNAEAQPEEPAEL